MPPSRRTVIPRAILHPQTASRAWGAFGFLQRLRPLPHQEAFRYDKRHCATWLPGFPSRRVSDQISIPFWFLPSHPILETRTLMVSRAVSSRPLTQQRRCPSKRCPRPFMSSRTRVGEGLFSHLKFSAHAAFPGQCPTPWMLAATRCGGQTRLPGRARKPPSVSNPTGRKGEKTGCHQFPRGAGADKRAQNNQLPVRLLDRSERVSLRIKTPTSRPPTLQHCMLQSWLFVLLKPPRISA